MKKYVLCALAAAISFSVYGERNDNHPTNGDIYDISTTTQYNGFNPNAFKMTNPYGQISKTFNYSLDGFQLHKSENKEETYQGTFGGSIYDNILGEDCDPTQTGYTGINKLSQFNDQIGQINYDSICLSGIYDQLMSSDERSKRYCECIGSKYKDKIDYQQIQIIDSSLNTAAMNSTFENAAFFLQVETTVDNVLRESGAQKYLLTEGDEVLCKREDVEKILTDLQEGNNTHCNAKKIDQVLGELHKSLNSAQVKGLEDTPKSAKDFFDTYQQRLASYQVFDQKFDKSIIEMLKIFLEDKEKKDRGEEYTAMEKNEIEDRINEINRVFKNNTVFTDITVSLNSGLVINKEGQFDFSKALPMLASPEFKQALYNSDAEALKGSLPPALQAALYQLGGMYNRQISNTKDNSETADKCNQIFKTFDKMCREAGGEGSQKAKALIRAPEYFANAFSDEQTMSDKNFNAMGALQCFMNGKLPNALTGKAKEYYEKHMKALDGLPDHFVASHLLYPSEAFAPALKQYLSPTDVATTPVTMSSPSKGKDALATYQDALQANKAAKKKRNNIFQEIGEAGSLLSRQSEMDAKEPISDHYIGDNKKKATFVNTQKTQKIPTSAVAPQASQQTGNIAGFVNSMTVRNQVHSKKAAQSTSKTDAQSKPAQKSGFEKFEERLAKLFNGDSKEDDKKDKGSKLSRSEQVKESYRLKTQQQQTIDELRKEINDLKKSKESTPAQQQSSSAPSLAKTQRSTTPFAPSGISSPAVSAANKSQAAAAGPTARAAGASSASATSRSTPTTTQSVDVGPSTKVASSGGAVSKGSSLASSSFNLSRDEIEGSDKFIISANNFDANDQKFIKDLFERTQGEPIFLSSTDENGNEKFIMLEAVEKLDGTIEYVPAGSELLEKDDRIRIQKGKKSSKGNKGKRSRVKVEDLNSLLGEKL